MVQESFQYKLMRFLNEMDFDVQKKAERLYMAIIIITAISSYVVAGFCQNFSICVYSTLGAMVVSYIVCVPGQAPWWQKPFPPFQPETQKIKNKKD